MRTIRPSAVFGAKRRNVLRRTGYAWTPGSGISSNSLRYREHARRQFVLEAVLEGSRDVALVSQCIHVLEYFPF